MVERQRKERREREGRGGDGRTDARGENENVGQVLIGQLSSLIRIDPKSISKALFAALVKFKEGLKNKTSVLKR